MRKASSFQTVRARRSKFDDCELGQEYFLAANIDYRMDDDTNEESNVPKESSIRSSLQNHANSLSKRLGKIVKVSVSKGEDVVEDGDTPVRVPGLGIRFFEPTLEQIAKSKGRKKGGKKKVTVPTEQKTSEVTTNS